MDVAEFQKSKGLTVTELAKTLNCSKGHASDLSKGKCKPGRKVALKLEELTGIPWHSFVNTDRAQ